MAAVASDREAMEARLLEHAPGRSSVAGVHEDVDVAARSRSVDWLIACARRTRSLRP